MTHSLTHLLLIGRGGPVVAGAIPGSVTRWRSLEDWLLVRGTGSMGRRPIVSLLLELVGLGLSDSELATRAVRLFAPGLSRDVTASTMQRCMILVRVCVWSKVMSTDLVRPA